MSSKVDQRQTKVNFLTEVAHYLLHLYAGTPSLPSERLARDDSSNAQYVWYRFVRNRDYMLLEKQSPNPDSCLNDIITENYPLLKPSFGALSRAGQHAFGVSEDRTYHHYFLLLPPRDELVLDADPLDKFVKKLVKRAQSFLKAFANGAPPTTTDTAPSAQPVLASLAASTGSTTASVSLPLPVAAVPVAAVQPVSVAVASQPPPPPPPPLVSAAIKRDRDALEQAAKDQEALRELQKEELAAKRARLADEAKRRADAEQQRLLDEQERAAKAEADEKARIVAEQERLEQERRNRIAQCPFPKRALGATGFVPGPFQTAEGLVVNPWFLLLD